MNIEPLYKNMTQSLLVRGMPAAAFYLLIFLGIICVLIIRIYWFIIPIVILYKLFQWCTKHIDEHFFHLIKIQFQYPETL